MTLKYGSSGIPMGKIQGGSGGSGGGVSFVIVTELPETGESGVFYLVPATGATSPNIYTEYIWIADENRYEKIGDKEVDLSNYYTKTETYNKTEVTALLEEKQDVFGTVVPLEIAEVSQRRGGIGKAYVAGTETEIETNDISAYNTDLTTGAVSLLLSGPIGYTTTNNVPGVDWTQDWEFEVKNVVIKSNTDFGNFMQIAANGGAFVSVYPYNNSQKLYFVCNMGTGAMSSVYVDYALNTPYDFKFTKGYNSALRQTVVTMAYCESGGTYSAQIIHNVTGYTAPTYSYITVSTTYQDINRADISLGDVTFKSNGVTLYNGGTIVTEEALKLNYNSTLELGANNKLGVSSSVLGYTKAETNELLDEKQDSFTTEAPLEMGSITRGGAYNITISSGRIVNDYQQALTFDSNTSGVVAISNANISNSPSTLSEFFTGNCSYFDIPTDAGARIANGENFVGKVWLNCGAFSSSYYPMFIWGYKNSQEEFIPVVFQRGFYTGGMFSGFVDSVSNVDTNTINLNCTTYSDVSNPGRGSSDYNGYYGYVGVLQYVSSSQTVVLNTVRQNNAEYYFNGCQTQDDVILANAKKINMVRVFAWMNGGFPPTAATYRVNGTDTDWNINDAAVTSTILELNYDNATLGVNGSGNLYAKNAITNPQGAGVYLYGDGKLYLDLAGDSDGYLDVTISDVDVATSTVNVNTSKFAAVGMPSTTHTSLTPGASQTQYTAPANGYYYLYGRNAGSTNCFCRLYNATSGIIDQRQLASSYGNITIIIPALKDEVVQLIYENVTIDSLYFIYAVGSESEAPTS